MNWLDKMNAVMDYIEDNLSGEIDYEEISKIACCPNYHFQRMFSFMMEIPISEYIRNRRLSLAAFELQRGETRVIEVAQMYGYTSHSAFTRAFMKFHGVTPTDAKMGGAQLRSYSRKSFNISCEGGEEVNYRIEDRCPFTLIGYKFEVETDRSFSMVPKIWQKVRRESIGENLLRLFQNRPKDSFQGILGVLSDGDWGEKDTFNYYAGVPYDGDRLDDMHLMEFPEHKWAVFSVPKISEFSETWKQIYEDWLMSSEYSLANLSAVECYYPPEHQPQNEIWIPIIKNEGGF